MCTEIIKHLYSFYARQGKDTIEVVDEMMQRECKNCAQCIESYYHAKVRTTEACGLDVLFCLHLGMQLLINHQIITPAQVMAEKCGISLDCNDVCTESHRSKKIGICSRLLYQISMNLRSCIISKAWLPFRA